MKPPKFLIAQNPLASERVFLVHTQKPGFLSEVLTFNDSQSLEKWQSSEKRHVFTLLRIKNKFIAVNLIYFLEMNRIPDEGYTDFYSMGLISRTNDWLITYFNSIKL